MLSRRDLLAGLGAGALAGCAGAQRRPGLSPPLVVTARPEPHVRQPPDRALARLFAALARIDDRDARGPVSIVQVGDSHSAGDFFSARMRELFQARFGAVGRGLLPPGRADRYYDPKLVSVSETGWQRESSRGGGAGLVPFGIAGVTQCSHGQARMTLTSDEPAGFDRVTVVFRRRPDGGSFAVSVDDGDTRMVSTRGAAETVRAEFTTGGGSRTLAVSASGDGEVDLLAWGTHRHAPGVLYQNFGIIGAQVDVLGYCDPQSVSTELHDAALLVVEYGTNEAFGSVDDLADYRDRFAQRVGALADAAPQASILIIGPPDVNRRARLAGADALACVAPAAPEAFLGEPGGAAAPELSLAAWHGRMTAGHARASRPAHVARGHGAGRLAHAGRHGHPGAHHAGAVGAGGGGAWARPAQVDIVVAAQQGVAAREGWAFWDWSAAMGGPCSMVGWVGQHLGRADHVHMSADGYGQSAELLFRDIMGRYDTWRGQANRSGNKLTARSGPG
jgi:hypothetical protein